MSWYRTGRVAVTNGSKTVTGVGTLFTTAVNVGDAFALVDANLNPTGAWYEVEAVVSNTELTLKQSYAGTTGSNNQYCVFNMVGNMTTPSFAQRLATFFASFQSLIDKPTATPTALGIPVADANGDIDDGWIPETVARVDDMTEALALKIDTATATATPTANSIPIADANGNLANEWISSALLATNEAMIFKGTLGTGGTVTALPTTGYLRGWTYKIITAGTYAGVVYEPGDSIVAVADFDTAFQNSDWVPVHIADEMNLKADVTYVDYETMEGDPA
jgi:hypothetical protein